MPNLPRPTLSPSQTKQSAVALNLHVWARDRGTSLRPVTDAGAWMARTRATGPPSAGSGLGRSRAWARGDARPPRVPQQNIPALDSAILFQADMPTRKHDSDSSSDLSSDSGSPAPRNQPPSCPRGSSASGKTPGAARPEVGKPSTGAKTKAAARQRTTYLDSHGLSDDEESQPLRYSDEQEVELAGPHLAHPLAHKGCGHPARARSPPVRCPPPRSIAPALARPPHRHIFSPCAPTAAHLRPRRSASSAT